MWILPLLSDWVIDPRDVGRRSEPERCRLFSVGCVEATIRKLGDNGSRQSKGHVESTNAGVEGQVCAFLVQVEAK